MGGRSQRTTQNPPVWHDKNLGGARDGLGLLVSVIDCNPREIVRWKFSQRRRTEDALTVVE